MCLREAHRDNYIFYDFYLCCINQLRLGHTEYFKFLSSRTVTKEAQVRTQACSCGICGVRVCGATGTRFFPATSVFPVNIILLVLHILDFIYHRRCMNSTIDSAIKQNSNNDRGLGNSNVVCRKLVELMEQPEYSLPYSYSKTN